MRLRSITARLTLLFFAVTLAAVAVVFFYVTPQLQSSLREQRLRTLAETAETSTEQIATVVQREGSAEQIDRIVAHVADRTGTRVTLLLVGGGPPTGLQLPVASDSNVGNDLGDLQFEIGERAVRTREVVTGTEPSAEGLQAQAAVPIFDGRTPRRVVVYSTPLAGVQDNVALIRRQVLVAGGLGMLLALVAGFLVSRTITRRVRALEHGAEKVAAGDFSARFPTKHDDELGQLARALDDMQRQLAQLESARRRFIATASHELRTPIFSIGGFVELLQDEDLDEATRQEFLVAVREQVARLGKLATDLLDLSKLEAGSLELRPEPTDLGVLAQVVTSEFVPALDKHDSHLELRLGGEPIEAVCDPERVAQVLRILIDNAITHTPAGTDMVVTASRHNGCVRLAVRDFGPGIGREAAGRVFEPFYTTDDAQGSGLGLAIAHELAERMNGSLAVDPTPGRTTFALKLPGGRAA